IEIQNMICPPRWNRIENFFGQVSVWIDESHSVASLNILTNQISEKRGFSRSGFTNYIKMLSAIDRRNAERFFASPNVSISDVSNFIAHFISKSKPYS